MTGSSWLRTTRCPMDRWKVLTLTEGVVTGLVFIHRYRFLTIPQFAAGANFSFDHAAEVLRRFESRGIVGHFGHVGIPGKQQSCLDPLLVISALSYLLSSMSDPARKRSRPRCHFWSRIQKHNIGFCPIAPSAPRESEQRSDSLGESGNISGSPPSLFFHPDCWPSPIIIKFCVSIPGLNQIEPFLKHLIFD